MSTEKKAGEKKTKKSAAKGAAESKPKKPRATTTQRLNKDIKEEKKKSAIAFLRGMGHDGARIGDVALHLGLPVVQTRTVLASLARDGAATKPATTGKGARWSAKAA